VGISSIVCCSICSYEIQKSHLNVLFCVELAKKTFLRGRQGRNSKRDSEMPKEKKNSKIATRQGFLNLP